MSRQRRPQQQRVQHLRRTPLVVRTTPAANPSTPLPLSSCNRLSPAASSGCNSIASSSESSFSFRSGVTSFSGHGGAALRTW